MAAGQVISRLSLKWDGRVANNVGDSAGAFQKILAFVVGFWVLHLMLDVITLIGWPGQDDNRVSWEGSNAAQKSAWDVTLRWIFLIIGVVLLYSQVRIRICILYVTCLVSFYWAIKFTFELDPVFALARFNNDSPPYLFLFGAYCYDMLRFTFGSSTMVVLRNIRSYVRQKYGIPADSGCPAPVEDCGCSVLCPCLVAAQLLRHTGDYERYPARCCSSNGLPEHIRPAIV